VTAPSPHGAPAEDELGFVHIYREPARPDAPVLVLLHGTGGDERDLLPLGEMLDPGAGILSPRGNVLERGMPRFFRRISEGVFDEEDLKRRAEELAGFLHAARNRYGLEGRTLVAVGFSNGANIAGGVLLLHPGALGAAVLIRAMVPLVPDPVPNLEGAPVLIRNGRRDPLIPPAEGERLAGLLRSAGGRVDLEWSDAGHELTMEDVARAREWISARRRPAPSGS
jgi:phospholipase/carboxylesterase